MVRKLPLLRSLDAVSMRLNSPKVSMHSLLCDESKEPRLCNVYLRNGRSGEANGRNFVVNIVAEDHIIVSVGLSGFLDSVAFCIPLDL